MSKSRLALILVVLLAIVSGCTRSTEPATTSNISFHPSEKKKPRVLGTLPRFQFQDQTGKLFTSERLNGKVWIATFFFTRCQETCPAQIAEFTKLQRVMANHPAADDLRLVSITVDPDFDTPRVLAAYAHAANADAQRWSFVTAPRDVIREISEKGFKLPLPNGSSSGPITHSQNFVLVDRVRRIRGYYDGLDETARKRMMQDLEIVLTDPAGPITERKQPDHALQAGPRIYVPLEVKEPPWLAERATAQELAMQQATVFHDFGFQDKRPESGITFVNRVVDDAAKDYKGVHYDHGNGIAIADINNDGLYDIYFVNQLGDNELYQNLGDGKFRNITGQAGVAVPNRIGVTASFADIDNDDDADLYVTTVRGGNVLFENDGTGKFTDISTAAGLDYNGHSSSAVFFDYDRDGLLDIFLTNPGVYTSDQMRGPNHFVGYIDAFTGHLKPERSEQSILYRNLGGNRFSDVSAKVGLVDVSWTGAASPIDVNQDGWKDLYVLSMQGHDEYYENQAGQKFLKKSRDVFPRTSWGAMGIKVFDFDNDQQLDILITDMHTDMIDEALQARRFWHAEKMKMTDQYGPRYLKTDGNHVLGNAFFHNQGNGVFREISDDVGVETYWPWGLSVGDLNADGFEDVFITASMNYPYRYAVNSLLLNEEGKVFRDSEFVLGVEPRRDGRTCQLWFELDCDGTDAQHELSQGRQGSVEVWGALGSRSSVIFDLDNDGDLDIVTNDFHSEPQVLVSDLAEKRPTLHYLSIRLQGTHSNRTGLGASVQVKAGDKTMLKVQDGQSGYLSQSVNPLYFGLGETETVDEIKVTWTTGKQQAVSGPIQSNRVLTIVEE